MKLRNFGTRSGFEVAPVSIGAMRLPDDCSDAVALIRHAIDSGMRYIDTSRGYGESEFKLGVALKDGYREKVILSSKCSPWIKKVRDDDDGSADSVRHRIDETIMRLGVEKLDFYQVWNINNRDAWELATKKGGMVEGIRKAMDDGLVEHTGFTTHDTVENLLEYLDVADWAEIILVTYNLLNRTYEPVLAKAKEKGIGTIAMNPVGGGSLTAHSDVIMELGNKLGAVSMADLAVRYVLSNPNVDTILCGMQVQSNVDDTIASANRETFSPDQVEAAHEFFASRSRENVGFCTGCKYCMPCPAGIDIPGIMAAIYDHRFLGLTENAKSKYKRATREVGPDACTDCGACETKCTQSLKVRSELKYALKEFAEVE
jgi:uncharacterized protein